MLRIPAPDFRLADTLQSGQAFRWRRQDHDGWYRGVMGQAAVRVRQHGDALDWESSDPLLSPEAVCRYFALDLDLPSILASIDVDPQIHEAVTRYRGLRILRQDGWETLASFICASFNNIKRIEGMIERLCQAYGEPVSLPGYRSFTFPGPERLAEAGERQLRALGLGYRAPYLRDTAQLLARGGLSLDQLRRVDYASAKKALMACAGVGDKVADCVALFGFEKYQAFPLDVWMERAMRYYFRQRKMTRQLAHEYAQRQFGPYAGYAQQYLFHYVRVGRQAGAVIQETAAA